MNMLCSTQRSEIKEGRDRGGKAKEDRQEKRDGVTFVFYEIVQTNICISVLELSHNSTWSRGLKDSKLSEQKRRRGSILPVRKPETCG